MERKAGGTVNFAMLTDFLATTLPRIAAPFFRDVVWRGPSHSLNGQPCIYLTFDDGPHAESTPQLLDFFGATNTSATFFFLGSQAELAPDLVRATVDAGHTIGNHGWAHRSAWRSSNTNTIADFERAETLLEDVTGKLPGNVRPPYGRFTPALRTWCRERERRLVLWDVMPGDFLPQPSDQLVGRLVERIVRRTRPGSIVVLHEGVPMQDIVIPALKQALPVLRDKGWTIAAL